MSSSPTETGAATVDVTMPQMGVSVAEGTVVEWRRQVGETVEADEPICDISTDKIDTEVPAPVSGTVVEIVVPVGETVTVGAVLARISTGAGGEPADAPSGAAPEAAAEVGSTEAAAALEPPSETAAPAPAAEATEAEAQSVAAAPTEPPASTNGHAAQAEGDGDRSTVYSPVVLRMAAEHGIDLSKVEGTGRGGRVRKQDVLAYLEREGRDGDAGAAEEPPLHIESPYRPEPEPPKPREASPAQAGPAPAPPAPQPIPAGAHPSLAAVLSTQGEPLSRMRRQIGEHMKRSLQTAATCTTWIEVDFSAVEARRADHGFTALPFVCQATIAALREHPSLNAWLEGETYKQFEEINLGIAVSLGEDGLIVPVVHGAQDLSVEGLSKRIRDLARRARSRELTPDEVQGGTFTITNPGQYGSIMATPVISQPQVAILDVEAVVKRPVVVAGPDGTDAIAIRPMCILGLSWDHRALDGALAAQFLASVKRHLEAL